MENKILIADDDHIMVDLLKTVLSMEGYQVSSLLDKPGEIISNVKKSKPGTLIMDVHLGNNNGLDVIRLIRNEPDLRNLKIIMVSGMEMKTECHEAGADAFLLKPYLPNELLKLLQNTKLETS